MNSVRILRPADADQIPLPPAQASEVTLRPYVSSDVPIITQLYREQQEQNIAFSLKRNLLSLQSCFYITSLSILLTSISLMYAGGSSGGGGTRMMNIVSSLVFTLPSASGCIWLWHAWRTQKTWEDIINKQIEDLEQRLKKEGTFPILLIATMQRRYVGFIAVYPTEKNVYQGIVVVHANHRGDAVYARLVGAAWDKLVVENPNLERMDVKEYHWQDDLLYQLTKLDFLKREAVAERTCPEAVIFTFSKVFKKT